jgi:hypothetical protein
METMALKFFYELVHIKRREDICTHKSYTCNEQGSYDAIREIGGTLSSVSHKNHWFLMVFPAHIFRGTGMCAERMSQI